MSDASAALIELSRELSRSVGSLEFSSPATHVYNPLDYAREGWEAYLRLAARDTCKTLLLGMNPGPWGMAQTGVPFGEIPSVREWMGIEVPVSSPKNPHPRRPIEGFDCTRSEVSGRRLWGLMRERCGTPENFFTSHFVANYCPLVFMAESGKNVTPDKLRPDERGPLFTFCDNHLRETIEVLGPSHLIGVGKFAESRIRKVMGPDQSESMIIGSILHPSPASPLANRGWAEVAERQMIELGAWD